ncbi:MAG: ATP-binding protein [Bacillota bacterium]
MNLVIASGKGGTGKTTVAVNLALAVREEVKEVQLLDCDVEEPNAHLFLKPQFQMSKAIGIPVPAVDRERCSFCGRCAEICVFNALAVIKDNVLVFAELCHGCGGCAYLCPEQAIVEVDRAIGVVESGAAYGLKFGHGRLIPGEAMSPPLINAVKKMIDPDAITIIDAPPGTSCPVVSAVKGCDFCLLVTEPTPFGLNDLELAYRMVDKLGIPAAVVINRCDIGSGAVEEYCRKMKLPVFLQIPWDRELAALYARGEPVALSSPAWRKPFRELFERVNELRKGGDNRERDYGNQRQGRDR